MSDPISRNEIEDVLSSIRRLVAQEGPATRDGGDGVMRTGKLILSPACRVETGADTVSRLSAVTATPADPAPAETAPAETGAAETGPAVDDATAPENAGPATDAAGAVPGTLESTIAELEAAVGAGPDVWEVEGDAPPPFVSGRVQLSLTPTPEAAPPVTPDHPADSGEGDEAPMMTDAPALPAPDNVHPFVAPPPAPTPAPVEAETAADPAPADEATQETTDDPGLLAEDATAILDEAALRELVAQILREELQGVLGQRITRNVRKMVRAEIAQALASRSL